MSDSSDIMDIDRENRKGKRRGYIAKLRELGHLNHVNKNVPEQSTRPDCKRRLCCRLQARISIIEQINAFDSKNE